MTTEQSKDKKILTKKEKGLNRHWKNFRDTEYLGGHNLEAGEEMLLTISKFEGEEMIIQVGGKKDEKVPKQVLYFVEDVPKMILNTTNANVLTMLYGSHPDQWIGKQIQIHTAKVKAFGKTHDAIRIREFIPKINVDLDLYTGKMMEAKTLDELKKIWKSFPQAAVNSPELIKRKDALKVQFEQDMPNIQ